MTGYLRRTPTEETAHRRGNLLASVVVALSLTSVSALGAVWEWRTGIEKWRWYCRADGFVLRLRSSRAPFVQLALAIAILVIQTNHLMLSEWVACG